MGYLCTSSTICLLFHIISGLLNGPRHEKRKIKDRTWKCTRLCFEHWKFQWVKDGALSIPLIFTCRSHTFKSCENYLMMKRENMHEIVMCGGMCVWCLESIKIGVKLKEFGHKTSLDRSENPFQIHDNRKIVCKGMAFHTSDASSFSARQQLPNIISLNQKKKPWVCIKYAKCSISVLNFVFPTNFIRIIWKIDVNDAKIVCLHKKKQQQLHNWTCATHAFIY